MTAAWVPYVPRAVVDDVVHHGVRACLGRERRATGAVLFADVSGFTRMSEDLGRLGRSGTEHLSHVLNDCFAALTDTAAWHGGDVARFGGDALTVVFEDPGAAGRARRCADAMQATMAGFQGIDTPAGRYDLAIKVGVAAGSLLSTTVGDPSSQVACVIAGGALAAASAIQDRARPGGIALDASAAAGDHDAPPKPADPPAVGPHADDLALFLHPRIRERLAAGRPDFVAEHRIVTVMFAGLDGLFGQHADAPAGEAMQAYFERVVAVLARYDATLVQTEVADKGSLYIVALGAPVLHEDDAERGLRCALDLVALAPAATRIGLSTGIAFCGHVGSPARREYSVFGDTVNTAARVMAAAERGEVLATTATRDRAGGRLVWGAVRQAAAKGKHEPIGLCPVLGVAEVAVAPVMHSDASQLVGRDVELAVALTTLREAAAGAGRVLAISGEPGLGKSRLAQELAERARADGALVLAGAAQSFGTRIAHLVWRGVWRDAFGLDPGETAESARRRLEAALAEVDPGLVPRAPLLGPLLGLTFSDTQVTASLDPELRVASLHSLLLTCLRHRAARGPVLVVLDDCHWIDPLSRRLLEQIGGTVTSSAVLLVVLSRPVGRPDAPTRRLERLSHTRTLALERLPDAAARRLVRAHAERLWPEGPPDAVVDAVAERAEGNPFYIEELVRYLRERGDRGAGGLPESIEALVLARVDRLAEREQSVLKVGSAVGRSFRARWISGSHPELGDTAVRADLETTTQLELTERERPDPDLTYAFRHAVMQETVYESLGRAMRAALHDRIGRFVEAAHADERETLLDVLAHHFDRSDNQPKRREYLLAAGEAAQQRYANEAAADYFERLLPLVAGAERSGVLRRLGDVKQLVGAWDAAAAHYRDAVALAEEAGASRERAEAESMLGYLLTDREDYAAAQAVLRRALAGFEALGDDRGTGRTLEFLSELFFQQGERAAGLAAARRHLVLAEARGDAVATACGRWDCGRHRLQAGDFGGALADLEAALELAEQAGDRRILAFAANELFGLWLDRGDHGRALAHLRRAYDATREMGAEQWATIAIGNAGELCRARGDLTSAYAYYAEAVRRAAELGDIHSALLFVGDAGAAAVAEGRRTHAGVLLEAVVDLARRRGAEPRLCEMLGHLAALREEEGRMEDAAACNDEALALAQRLGSAEFAFRATLLAARLAGARSPLEELLVEELTEAERADVLYELWRLDRSREDLRDEAASSYERLYAKCFSAEHRRRHTELTGRTLAAPPPLQPLDGAAPACDGLATILANLDDLLERADALTQARTPG